MPDLKNQKEGDFFFLEAETPEEVSTLIQDLVVRRLPATYGIHPAWDIQVLTPQNRGVVGTQQLNHVLQQKLVDTTAQSIIRDGKPYIGDKVMQLRNNFQGRCLTVFEQIKAIYSEDEQVVVSIDGRDIHLICMYGRIEFGPRDHSQVPRVRVPHVVMPVHTTHFKMLSKNILYTGIRQSRWFGGYKKAISIAVNDNTDQRFTGLQAALCLIQCIF